MEISWHSTAGKLVIISNALLCLEIDVQESDIQVGCRMFPVCDYNFQTDFWSILRK